MNEEPGVASHFDGRTCCHKNPVQKILYSLMTLELETQIINRKRKLVLI